jgi:hypothetical protein
MEFTSRTTTPAPMSRPAARDAGGPPNSCHILARIFARARAIRRGWTAPISSRARQTVVSEATGPNTSCWWRSTSMSQIASPPSAIITARSTMTLPRSWTDHRRWRASPADTPDQPRPVSQYPQQRRTDMRHHTRPVRGSFDHAADCTAEDASLAEILCRCRNHKFPVPERHFRLSIRRPNPQLDDHRDSSGLVARSVHAYRKLKLRAVDVPRWRGTQRDPAPGGRAVSRRHQRCWWARPVPRRCSPRWCGCHRPLG